MFCLCYPHEVHIYALKGQRPKFKTMTVCWSQKLGYVSWKLKKKNVEFLSNVHLLTHRKTRGNNRCGEKTRETEYMLATFSHLDSKKTKPGMLLWLLRLASANCSLPAEFR